MKPKIGFVGVGKMGSNMARRLFDLKYPVTAINDSRAETGEALARELDSRFYSQLAEVTAHSDIIFTVVTDDQAMKSIFERPGDNLLKNAKGKIFINCATFTPNLHVRLANLINDAGADVLEAPMASSITQARSGKLYLMCGGSQELFERLTPLLDDMSISKKFIGGIGAALQMKALVNMVMNINTAALAEGLGLASFLGLDLNVVKEVFGNAGAASRVLVTDAEDMINREHEAFFTAAHAAKDCGIALDVARQFNVNVPLAQAAKLQYDKLGVLGLGHLDKSAISELTFKGRSASVVTRPVGSNTVTGAMPNIKRLS